MKKTACILALLVGVLSSSALGDWDTDDLYKWLQMPDLDTTGIDVSATADLVLADDFLCTEPDSITSIHIWGSWRYDYLPVNSPDAVDFTICIYADVPDSLSPSGYSIPGDVLWTKTYVSGEFTSRVWAGGPREGFWEPGGEYKFPGDTVCYQYNFPIPKEEYFHQTGTPADPVVYWLGVQAKPRDQNAAFGWKTSLDHWNDDAVFGQGEQPIPGPWYELRYPAGHDMAGESIDLAFVIVGPTYGLDWGDAPDTLGAPRYATLAAHNGASHVARGPWLGGGRDRPDEELDGQPDALALGDDLNDIADEDGLSVTAIRPEWPFMLLVSPRSTPGDTSAYLNIWVDWNGNGVWESPDEELISDWVRTDTVGALSPLIYLFWLPEDAIEGSTFLRARINSEGPLPPHGPADNGEVEDHEVLVERDYGEFKWLQRPRHGVLGMDVMATYPYILADDFLCTESGGISEVTVWGAWEDDRLPFGNAPDSVKFVLSFHSNVPDSILPGDLDTPGNVLWTRTFLPGEFSSSIDSVGREVLWMAPDDAMASYGDSVLWRYKFPIPLDEAFVQSGSWEDPEVYWMDLQAFPYDPDAHFGWRSSKNTWRSIATWGSGLEPYLGPWQGLYHRHPHPLAGLLIDLAFMLRSGPSSSVPSGAGARDEFGLRQNVPNPFAHKSEIRYGLARQGRVKIEIFDVKGEIVATLVDEVKPAGEHAIWWNGRDAAGKKVPSGVYFYRLKSGGRQATMKLILLR